MGVPKIWPNGKTNYPKWPKTSPSGLITILSIVNVCTVTTASNLDLIGGYLLAAWFSAVPAVFLVLCASFIPV